MHILFKIGAVERKVFLLVLTRPDQYPRLPALLTANQNRRPETVQLFLLILLLIFLPEIMQYWDYSNQK